MTRTTRHRANPDALRISDFPPDDGGKYDRLRTALRGYLGKDRAYLANAYVTEHRVGNTRECVARVLRVLEALGEATPVFHGVTISLTDAKALARYVNMGFLFVLDGEKKDPRIPADRDAAARFKQAIKLAEYSR
jgi:hypothetical protein